MNVKKGRSEPVMRGGGPMSMAVPGEKAKNFKKTFVRLAKLLKPQLPVLTFMVLFAIGSTVLSVITPEHNSKFLNAVTVSAKSGQWNSAALLSRLTLIAVFFAGSAVLMFVSQFISSKMSQTVVYNMRKELNAKLNRLPISFFDSESKGDILSRITNDIETIAVTLQQSVTQIITSVVSVAGILFMMFKNHVTLTFISLLSLPVIALITVFIARFAQRQFAAQQRYLGAINGQIEENFTGHRIEKLFGHEEKSQQHFEEKNAQLRAAGQKAQFISGIIMPVLNFVNNVMYVVMVVIGAWFVTKGNNMDIGLIYLFTTYSRQLSQPINQTASIANIIQSTVAAAERVFEIMDEREMSEDNETQKEFPEISGSVAFENVDFSYSPDRELIKNMNINVKAGGIVAIVGPTGAGKTTLVNLLMRFYDVDGGRILLDGQDICDYSRSRLRRAYSMVLQDTWLFAGSIRDNIAYGKPDATFEEIEAAAEQAHIAHYIKTLDRGYDTVLSEDASNLSQGQKQLLTIARAICADYKILILDEATSSVDTRTESYIQNAMTKMMKGKTSFVIAHRLSTIKKADLILVMDEGSVVEQGTHRELIERNGFYAELYNSQFAAG